MHKNYTFPSKILDEYLELARNKATKTRASRVNAIFEFYSTRSIIFFQDKISVERVESSKMSTLLSTSASSNRNRLHTNETSPNDDLITWLSIEFWPYYDSRMFGFREGPLLNEFLLTLFQLQPLMIFHLIFDLNFFSILP